jgi:hypothetical protein
MKKLTLTTIIFLSIFSFNVQAQEKFGNTLNLGLGIGGYSGYYGYVGRTLPVFHIDYEFSVAKNFTLAPFISFYSYTNQYYWGNNNNPDRWYTYTETVIPLGIKGTYYFDDLLQASPKWDFYLAGSLGFAIVNSHWDAGYNGNVNYYHTPNPLFLDLHIGTEYHFNNRIGAFLDLSTGVSTVGLAIHN